MIKEHGKVVISNSNDGRDVLITEFTFGDCPEPCMVNSSLEALRWARGKIHMAIQEMEKIVLDK